MFFKCQITYNWFFPAVQNGKKMDKNQKGFCGLDRCSSLELKTMIYQVNDKYFILAQIFTWKIIMDCV